MTNGEQLARLRVKRSELVKELRKAKGQDERGTLIHQIRSVDEEMQSLTSWDR